MNKTYVMTDIHGCLNTMEDLLNKIKAKSSDTLIFLGDYIDRGPFSKGVLDLVIELQYNNNCVFLKGNHEDMLLNVLNQKPHSLDVFYYNGGVNTIKSFGDGGLSNITGKYKEFLDALQLSYETRNYIFVHAGLGISKPYINYYDSLWTREPFIDKNYSFLKKKIIFGHTPFKKPLIKSDKIGIDTGCVFGNKLSCLVLPEEKIISVRKSEKDCYAII